jgi:hypothetical protein
VNDTYKDEDPKKHCGGDFLNAGTISIQDKDKELKLNEFDLCQNYDIYDSLVNYSFTNLAKYLAF